MNHQEAIQSLIRLVLLFNEGDIEEVTTDGFTFNINDVRIQVVVLNRIPMLSNIENVLTINSAHGVYTMFVFDRRFLPADNEVVPWEVQGHTFRALHGLNYGRIYTYAGDDGQGDVDIHSVHFESVPPGLERRIMVKDMIDPKFQLINQKSEGPFLKGAFKVANFSEGPFWKHGATGYNGKFGTQSKGGPTFNFEGTWQDAYYREYVRPGFGRSNPGTFSYEDLFGKMPGSGAKTKGGWQKPSEAVKSKPKSIWPWSELGLDSSATYEEARAAYKRLALQYHPDHNKATDATAKMQNLNNAWDAIRKTFA